MEYFIKYNEDVKKLFGTLVNSIYKYTVCVNSVLFKEKS